MDGVLLARLAPPGDDHQHGNLVGNRKRSEGVDRIAQARVLHHRGTEPAAEPHPRRGGNRLPFHRSRDVIDVGRGFGLEGQVIEDRTRDPGQAGDARAQQRAEEEFGIEGQGLNLQASGGGKRRPDQTSPLRATSARLLISIQPPST